MFPLKPLRELCVEPRACLMHMVRADPEDYTSDHWYVQDGKGRVFGINMEIGAPEEPQIKFNYHGGPVLACALSPSSHLAATVGQDQTLRVFDCLQRVQIFTMTFKSPASCLVWVPLSVDVQAASVIVGFESGIVRKVAFSQLQAEGAPLQTKTSAHNQPESRERSTSLTYHTTRSDVTYKLAQVFKPHNACVNSLAFSHDGKNFATGGSDNTLFLFDMQGTNFEPIGWLTLPGGIRQLAWTPSSYKYSAVLAACEDGVAVEVLMNNLSQLTVTANYRITNASVNVFKLQSVKSVLEHIRQVELLRAEWTKAKEENKERKREESEEAQAEGRFEEEEEEMEEEFEEDKEWEPYIPETPSPIMQVMYSIREHHVWLCMGDYDADYVYLCQLPDQPVPPEDVDVASFLRKPVNSVRIPDFSGAPITVLKMTRYGQLAVLGFADGHIRLVQTLCAKELEEMGAYWDLAVHDVTTGHVTGVEHAFDGSFYITTAMDGNVMLFDDEGQFPWVQQQRAVLPTTSQHHGTVDHDLSPETLWFPLSLDHEDHLDEINAAEAAKKLRRGALKELQKMLKGVLVHNESLPPLHRLVREELLINSSLDAEHREQQDQRVADVRLKFAWYVAKSNIMLEKLKNGLYREENMPFQITVDAFNRPFKVSTLRVRNPLPGLRQYLVKLRVNKSRRYTMAAHGYVPEDEDDQSVSSTDAIWQNAYTMTRRMSQGLNGSAARALKIALDRAQRAKEKRRVRKKQWDELWEEKALVDKDSPHELAKIDLAQENIGHLELKTDQSHAVLMADGVGRSDPRVRLARVDEDLCYKVKNFNRKVDKMRQDKLEVMRIYHYLDERLRQVSRGTKRLPPPPAFSKEEVPEMTFSFDQNTLVKFRKDNKSSLDEVFITQSASLMESKRGAKKETKATKVRYEHKYYMAERSDYPEIVHFALTHKAPAPPVPDDIDKIFLGQADDSELGLGLRRDINVYYRLKIDYEEALANTLIISITDDFDDRLDELRKEKLHLDLAMKMEDLEYIQDMHEVQVDKETSVEQRLLTDEMQTQDSLVEKNLKATIHLKKQISERTSEIEHLTEMQNDLWFRFKVMSGINEEKMIKYLTLLFKRRVKRTPERKADDEDEDSDSGSSSEMSDMMSGSGSGSDVVEFNLDYCPDSLERETYDRVLELQAERQDMDDKMARAKDHLVLLNADLKVKTKEADVQTKAVEELQARLVKFYENKLVMLNDILVVVVMYAYMIHASTSQGLVVERKTLRCLLSREGELKSERKENKQMIQFGKRHHFLLLRALRMLRHKIEVTEKRCYQEMVTKFGKEVNMKTMELVTLNPRIEILKCKLLAEREVHCKELEAFDKDTRRLRDMRRDTTRELSSKTHIKTDMILHKATLERVLDKKTKKGNADMECVIECGREKLKGREQACLGHLIREQAGVIEGCWEAIDILSRKPTARLPPLPETYCPVTAAKTKQMALKGLKKTRVPLSQ